MTVLVAIPYFQAEDYIERCVRSVLDQTFDDLLVVVVGDGEEPPLTSIHDDRLQVYTLPENHGTYFVHELILEANPFSWHAMVDADDWVDPTHIERLLAVGKTAVASGTLFRHDTRYPRHEYQGTWATPMGSHCGLFDVERLRRIGGYSPQRRIAEDTLVLKLLFYSGGYFKTTFPTYHRVKRPGSLTVAPDTGIGTKLRADTWASNLRILGRCRKLLPNYERVRDYRSSLVDPQVYDELREHVVRLRSLLTTDTQEGVA